MQLEPLHVVGLVVALLLLLSWMGSAFAKRGSNASRELRRLIGNGQLRKAGELQYRNGNLHEAYSLFVQARALGRASRCAESLGELPRAAHHAEEAGDFKRAARLYSKAGLTDAASAAYQRAGDFFEAARLLTHNPTTPPLEVGRLWQKAFLAAIPGHTGPLDPGTAERLRLAACSAAEAFMQAGDILQAAHFFEISGQTEKAKHLRQGLPNASAPSPDAVAMRERIQQALQHAPPPPGAHTSPLQPAPAPLPDLPPGPLRDPLPGPLRDPTPGTLRDPTPGTLRDPTPGTLRAPPPGPLFEPGKRVDEPDTGRGSAGQRSASRATPIAGAAAQAPSNPHLAARLSHLESSRYAVLETIGEGGMGIVVRARDSVLDRFVALKFLSPDVSSSETHLNMFEAEAKAVAALNHPNIVVVHDYGVMRGRPFICMELCAGQVVSEMIDEVDGEGLPLNQIVTIADGLLAALHYAHERGFIHRDIKPSNIMCSPAGIIKLMDFGIAKLNQPEKATRIAGTPAYMSPEQMVGRGVDQRSDIFALGATVYEMMTGCLPFDGMMRDTPPPPASALSPEIPDGFAKIIARCLSPNPDDRPQTVDPLQTIVKRLLLKLEMEYHPFTGGYPVVGADTPSPSRAMALADTIARLPGERVAAVLSTVTGIKRGERHMQTEAVLRVALSDDRAEVRAAALEYDPRPVAGAFKRLLLDSLHDPTEEVRISALQRLGETKDPGLLGVLAGHLDDARGPISPTERQALYRSVAKIGGLQAITLLKQAFHRHLQQERGDRDTLVSLLQALGSMDMSGAAGIKRELETLSGISAPEESSSPPAAQALKRAHRAKPARKAPGAPTDELVALLDRTVGTANTDNDALEAMLSSYLSADGDREEG